MKPRITGSHIALLVGLFLSACTPWHQPEPVLPPRSGVVPGQTITVGANQNLYGIAQQYGVSMRDIIVLNGLHEPLALKPGQSLVLPFKRGDANAGAMMPEPATPAVGGTMPTAGEPSIESQELPPPVMSSPSKPSSDNHSAVGAVALAPVEALNAPTASTPLRQATMMESAPAAEAVAAPNMVWPVQGPLLSGFGPKGQGVNNDGVNIGAPKGSPVVAAAGGTVAYAGNEMKGFGNLVLIRHEGDWVTAYAYLDRVLVSKDAVVAQGDEIGTVGKSGNVASPQLHFETRHNGKAVDPSGVIKQ